MTQVAIFTLTWTRSGRCTMLGQVVYWVELPVQRRLYPIFIKSRVLEKKDSIEWCRVTRHSRIFRGLTGYQWTPGIGASQNIQVR